MVTCPPPSPRAQPAEEVAEAARSLGCRAVATGSVAEALEVALGRGRAGRAGARDRVALRRRGGPHCPARRARLGAERPVHLSPAQPACAWPSDAL